MAQKYYRLYSAKTNEFIGYAPERLHQACNEAGERGTVRAMPAADVSHNGLAVYVEGAGEPVFTEASS